MTAPTLVCCAAPIGYGPATKLVVLAGAARARGLRPLFLGTGSALEVARRSDVFDEVVAAEPGDTRARETCTAGAGLLSLMERDHLRAAQALDRPTFVADSLLWMREAIPAPFRAATRYWAQDFVGVRHRAAGIATVVGPIVSVPTSRTAGRRRLVVTLGGLPCPTEDDVVWLDLLVDALVESGLVAGFPESVCMASEACRAVLAERHAERGLRFVSSSPEAAHAILASAALVVTAPGLTTTLECFQLGVPTVFLPPFSYSQWRILAALRAEGLAPHAVHWADHLTGGSDGDAVTPGMPEAGRPERVRAAIRPLLRDARVRSDLRAGLAAAGRMDAPALARRQRAFFDQLGRNGVDEIVTELCALCAPGGCT